MDSWNPIVVKDTFVAEDDEVFEGHKLVSMGDAKVLVLDPVWVERHAPHGWVELGHHSDSLELIIRPLTEAKFKAIQENRVVM